jgi:transposase
MLFANNVSPRLSIDETALSNGELYTVVTNKEKPKAERVLLWP